MIDRLKSLITEKQTANGNKSGTTIIQLMNELQLTQDEINPLLMELYEAKFIRVRQGINSRLLFLR